MFVLFKCLRLNTNIETRFNIVHIGIIINEIVRFITLSMFFNMDRVESIIIYVYRLINLFFNCSNLTNKIFNFIEANFF